MKTLFLEARGKLHLDAKELEKLPGSVGLVGTVQFESYFEGIKDALSKLGKKCYLGSGTHTRYPGQVLGCDIGAARAVADKVDAILFIGTGRFHPRLVSFDLKKDVFCLDPGSGKVEKIGADELAEFERIKKRGLVAFHSSENIGVLFSVKPGQNNLALAKELEAWLARHGKKPYLFLADNLDFNDLENFPFIDCFLNTMCFRIGLDDNVRTRVPIVNLQDVYHPE